jgi:hypothetical protein
MVSEIKQGLDQSLDQWMSADQVRSIEGIP